MSVELKRVQQVVDDFLDGDEILVIHAGHFLLLYDKIHDSIIPGIESYMKHAGFDEKLCEEMGKFPVLTWELGVKLLRTSVAPKKNLLIIVNDWQYLQHLKNRRYEFYNHSSKLVDKFRIILENEKLSDRILLKPPAKAGTGLYFSEKYLRKKFQRSVKKLGKHVNFDEYMCEYLEKTGVFCARPNCAAEIAQLVADVAHSYEKKISFVNLYPLTCRHFVEEGTRIALELFGLENIRVLNIGIPNSSIKSIEDISNQMYCSKQE